MQRKILEQSYGYALSEGYSWFMFGNRLLRASIILLDRCWEATEKRDRILGTGKQFVPGTDEFEALEDSQLYEQATLLLALAIENMLKGLRAGQKGVKIRTSKKLPSFLKTHDLKKIADETGLSLSESELETLHVLTEHAIWAGKYPMPILRDDYVNSFGQLNRLWIMQKYPGPPELPDTVSSLIKKILSKMESIETTRKNP